MARTCRAAGCQLSMRARASARRSHVSGLGLLRQVQADALCCDVPNR